MSSVAKAAATKRLGTPWYRCDEIWSFCYGKDKNLPEDKKDVFGYGSVWTWTAIDAETKLMASWMVGTRDAQSAKLFIDDLAGRLSNKVQLTTDGHKPYIEAVADSFGADIDYAMLIKLYDEERQREIRYSPAVCIGARVQSLIGAPDRKHVSTSYVGRQNLTMSMGMRRFTRLTDGFSKKLENHIAAISLHFMYYNFVRIHQTPRITPAMAAGLTDRAWGISDIVWLRKPLRWPRRRTNATGMVLTRLQADSGLLRLGPCLRVLEFSLFQTFLCW